MIVMDKGENIPIVVSPEPDNPKDRAPIISAVRLGSVSGTRLVPRLFDWLVCERLSPTSTLSSPKVASLFSVRVVSYLLAVVPQLLQFILTRDHRVIQ